MKFEINIKSIQNLGIVGKGILTITNKGNTISNWEFQLTTIGFIIIEFVQSSTLENENNIIVKPPIWKKTLHAGEILEIHFIYINNNPLTNLIHDLQISSLTPGIT